MAYLTGDTPTGLQAFTVHVPKSLQSIRNFWGILLILEQAESYEQVGEASPDDIAELWREANELTIINQDWELDEPIP